MATRFSVRLGTRWTAGGWRPISRSLGSAPSKKRAVNSREAFANSTAASTDTDSTAGASGLPKSRWQLLKAARRKAAAPKNRIPKGLKEAPEFPAEPVGLSEAISVVQRGCWSKFDESIDIVVRLNVDPRISTQNIRTHALLPHGTGQRATVAVLDGEDWSLHGHVGTERLLKETAAAKGRNLKHVKVALTSKYLQAEVAKAAGRALGPRGLLPHDKEGTVIRGDLKKAADTAATKWVRLRVDRGGNVHSKVGKASMKGEEIRENVLEVMKRLVSVKPVKVKRKYVLRAMMSSTMGRSVELDLEALGKETKMYDSELLSL